MDAIILVGKSVVETLKDMSWQREACEDCHVGYATRDPGVSKSEKGMQTQ